VTANTASDGPYLSICAVYYNEAPYLREWIEFHRIVGFEKFFLYNNRSEDEHLEVLAPYIDDGTVIWHDWPLFPGQIQAYDDCLQQHRHDSRWIAFIDLDEFLFSPTGRPVPDMLVDLEQFPGVGVHWAVFGFSDHIEKPPGLVVENYIRRTSRVHRNYAVKAVIDPRRTVRCGNNPHYFFYEDGSKAVDENGDPLQYADRGLPVSFARLRLNHYVTKSESERRRKLARPVAFDGRMKNVEKILELDRRWLDDVRDETILLYLPMLREALAAAAQRI
jgi:glycosyl transferase family 92